MKHSESGLSLINMVKTRKLSCEGSYKNLVNILANYKGTWEEILDISLILEETNYSRNAYFIREKEFIDDLVKKRVFTGAATTTRLRLDEFLKKK